MPTDGTGHPGRLRLLLQASWVPETHNGSGTHLVTFQGSRVSSESRLGWRVPMSYLGVTKYLGQTKVKPWTRSQRLLWATPQGNKSCRQGQRTKVDLWMDPGARQNKRKENDHEEAWRCWTLLSLCSERESLFPVDILHVACLLPSPLGETIWWPTSWHLQQSWSSVNDLTLDSNCFWLVYPPLTTEVIHFEFLSL